MFIEPNLHKKQRIGSIEVICGGMFSGKTEELIRRLKRAQIAQLKVEIFKPQVDQRYDEDSIVSHDANAIRSTALHNARQLEFMVEEVDVVGIDEAQFFDLELVPVVNRLAERGIRVIIAGLDMDFLGQPFEPIPQLMAVADTVTKVQAICVSCGALALYSHRTSKESKRVVLGASENYQPLCRSCYPVKTNG